MDRMSRRARVLNNHLAQTLHPSSSSLRRSPCLVFSPPELTEKTHFDTAELRKLTDGHNLKDRYWLCGLMVQSRHFNPRNFGGRVFISPDYNQSMEQQREMTMRRIGYLLERGVFNWCFTGKGVGTEMRKFAFLVVVRIFDQSLAIKLDAYFFSCVVNSILDVTF